MCGYHVKKLTLGQEFLSVDQATLPEIKVGRSNFRNIRNYVMISVSYAYKNLVYFENG